VIDDDDALNKVRDSSERGREWAAGEIGGDATMTSLDLPN
jgi:hypothetical protein